MIRNVCLVFLYVCCFLNSGLAFDEADLTKVSINLKQYDIKSSTTNCTNGLLAHIDRFIAVGFIDIEQPLQINDMVITFQIETNTSSVPEIYKTVQGKSCMENSEDEEVVCTKIDEANSFKVILNITAVQLLNGMDFFLTVYLDDFNKTNGPISVPPIYDLSDVNFLLNANKVNSSTTRMEASMLTLCCVNAPSPCFVMVSNQLGEQVNNENCVNVTHEKDMNYTIHLLVCDNVKRFVLNVTSGQASKSLSGNSYWNSKTVVGYVLLSLTVIVVSLILLRTLCSTEVSEKSNFTQNLLDNGQEVLEEQQKQDSNDQLKDILSKSKPVTIEVVVKESAIVPRSSYTYSDN
ncbi:hypothetical protein Bpfe_001239 [Biomphalaria pfeifferi]|uniref:Transmembrane protein n=1 Tax=Biomphalaria pfeifferi TaxID=112525 RepID=A0AAD8CA07_BIOPF|nr:hypothetical protein Bpfe_001239 [Biomphalaria pfeifferi]